MRWAWMFGLLAACGHEGDTLRGFEVRWDIEPRMEHWEIDEAWLRVAGNVDPPHTIIHFKHQVAPNTPHRVTGWYSWNAIGPDTIDLWRVRSHCFGYPSLVHEFGHLRLRQTNLTADGGHTNEIWERIDRIEKRWIADMCRRREENAGLQ